MLAARLSPRARERLVVECNGVRCAVVICADAGIEGLHEELRNLGVDFRLCPTGGGKITDMLHEDDLRTVAGRERYVTNRPRVFNVEGAWREGGMADDVGVYMSFDPAWEVTSMGWFVVPWGFRKMLGWIAKRYPGLPIYVTENGCAVHEPDAAAARNDEFRCRFIRSYIDAMKQANREDGVDVHRDIILGSEATLS